MTNGRIRAVKTHETAHKKASHAKTKSPRKKPRENDSAPIAVHPRVARREKRRERSREEIVAAARRVVLRDGVGATTLDAIAKEVGLTKAALYYYYPSKDALLFEIMFEIVEREARAISDAVANAQDGGDALRAIVRETVHVLGARLDDFRLVFLHPQVAGPNAVPVDAEQLSRIRPLNDLAYKDAAKILAEQWKNKRGRAGVEPRLMVFLANVAALGILTMKGLVESFGDPLLYSDEQMIDALAKVFEAAAAP
jgi:AcrR family transcriptional regulator